MVRDEINRTEGRKEEGYVIECWEEEEEEAHARGVGGFCNATNIGLHAPTLIIRLHRSPLNPHWISWQCLHAASCLLACLPPPGPGPGPGLLTMPTDTLISLL